MVRARATNRPEHGLGAHNVYDCAQPVARRANGVPKRDNFNAKHMVHNALANDVTWTDLTWPRAVDAFVIVECDDVDGIHDLADDGLPELISMSL